MAVAPMTKAQIIIHGSASHDVVQRIYDLGVLHVVDIVEHQAREASSQLQGLSDEMNFCLAELESRLREVTRARNLLADYDDAKRPVIGNFVTLKERVPRQTLKEVLERFEFLKISKQLQDIAERLKHLIEKETWLRGDVHLLHTLAALPFPFSELQSLSRARIIIGQIRKETKPALLQALAEFEDRMYLEDIAETGQTIYLFILYLPLEPADPTSGSRDAIVSIIEQQGIDPLDLSAYTLRSAEEIERLTRELAEVQTHIAQHQQQMREFLPYITRFKIVEDFLLNEIERCKNFENFAETEKVYFVEGWMKQQDKPRLQEGLREFEALVDVTYDDAAPSDRTVPVLLENPRYLQPFEIITRMFGIPQYHEPDPTPILAPFFILFFGLCLGDAGYGMLLALLMTWLMRKYVLDRGTRNLAKLLVYGGLSTIVCGALTGGWLGNTLDLLPPSLQSVTALKNAIVVIDPLQQPIQFLFIALAIGYTQVVYGIFLKLTGRMQRGELRDALLDEGVWLIFVNSVVVLLVLNLSGLAASSLGVVGARGLLIAVIISGVLRIWYQKRSEPNVVKRVLSGILSLYDLVGVFSDVLSYSRLLALGLATGVIASVVNMLAMMVMDAPIPVLGTIVGVFIFCLGHVLNLVINTLGSFIHSGRLQFVEFFSKFFESGGKRYKPFRFESKYFEIIE